MIYPKKLLCLVGLSFSFAVFASATINVENQTDFGSDLIGATTGTVTNFAVANDVTNPHRYLLVAFAGEHDAAPTSVTYGGTPLVELVSATTGSSQASIFGLASPTPGLGDIAVTGFGPNGSRFGVLSLNSDSPIQIFDTQTSTAAGGTPANLTYAALPSSGLFVESIERNTNTDGLDTVAGTAFFGPGAGNGGYGAVGVYGSASAGALSHSFAGISDRHAIAGLVVVPEPSAWGLVPLVGLLVLFRRRR